MEKITLLSVKSIQEDGIMNFKLESYKFDKKAETKVF